VTSAADCDAADMTDALRRADRWLDSAGCARPVSAGRLAALLVGDGAHRHVTAEALHAAARDAGMPVALATVYNTLKCFTEAGLLSEITVDGARSYFDTRTEDHPHFYQEEDGALYDAPARAWRSPPAGTARGLRDRPRRRGVRLRKTDRARSLSSINLSTRTRGGGS
jgi:Fur family iron response transcriptional regulator